MHSVKTKNSAMKLVILYIWLYVYSLKSSKFVSKSHYSLYDLFGIFYSMPRGGTQKLSGTRLIPKESFLYLQYFLQKCKLSLLQHTVFLISQPPCEEIKILATPKAPYVKR